MKKIYGFAVLGSWIAILAISPYVYHNRKFLSVWEVVLLQGVILFLGIATVFLILSFFDKDE